MKNKFLEGLKRFVREEDAPTMAEYGLLLVFIALVVVVGAHALGISLSSLFSDTATSIDGVSPPTLPTPGA